jgi:hypothetical protein
MLVEASIYPNPVVSETRTVILNLIISRNALIEAETE